MTMSGVLAPVITPFKADLSPDADRLVRQCRWLLAQDCGLAVFGTNSEANSMAVDEKIVLLDALVGAGLAPSRMMPGTGACAIPDAVRLSARAAAHGCGGVLMLPPFYYKGVSDDGLFRYYAEVIERVGDTRLKVYLYHIPQVAQVGLSLELIARLVERYPETVVGIKDSSGDWNNTSLLLERFPGWGVFAGSEGFLLRTLRAGGRGCISATCNVNAAAIARLYREWRADGAEALQADLDATRAAVGRFPMIPALKTIIAQFANDPAWRRVRPPLVELDEAQRAALITDLEGRSFTLHGL